MLNKTLSYSILTANARNIELWYTGKPMFREFSKELEEYKKLYDKFINTIFVKKGPPSWIEIINKYNLSAYDINVFKKGEYNGYRFNLYINLYGDKIIQIKTLMSPIINTYTLAYLYHKILKKDVAVILLDRESAKYINIEFNNSLSQYLENYINHLIEHVEKLCSTYDKIINHKE